VTGSFYICGMALFPEYRGKGLGTGMLELTRQQAYSVVLRSLAS
jgi:GNAT superfamily N-acetyltransferase